MNVYEMEGFLRGKCLPGDLLVGESHAAYLVRKLNESATLKADRDALAERVERLSGMLAESRHATKAAVERADALAVENAALNSGCGFFAYDPDNGFEEFKTKEEAIAAAESYIDYYRGEACDGWPDEVAQVSWGIIMQESTRVNERPRTNDDSCDPDIETVCDYALLPNIETPATSAALAAIEALGVEKFAQRMHEKMEGLDPIKLPAYAEEVDHLISQLYAFAAQLREAK